jgi:hypothetical protein
MLSLPTAYFYFHGFRGIGVAYGDSENVFGIERPFEGFCERCLAAVLQKKRDVIGRDAIERKVRLIEHPPNYSLQRGCVSALSKHDCG